MSKWIEWNGGEMPVQKGTKITVKHRDGSVLDDFAGGIYSHDWYHTGSHADSYADIVAYMIHEKKGHPNAEILMEIAKEAAINPEYWKEYEVKFYDGETIEWIVCRNESDLFYGLQNDINIRRKPRTIRIGNYDVPEPMRETPEMFSDYFLVCTADPEGVSQRRKWRGIDPEPSWLSCGVMQETKEGAELMLKALQELLNGEKNDLSDDSYTGIHY